MAARYGFVSLWAAAMLLGTTLGIAQDAPIPAPRPADRMPEGTPGPAPEPAPQAALPTIPAETPGVPAQAPRTPALSAIATASQAAAALAVELQPVHLSARITEDGGVIPEGVVWRIFEVPTDPSGELALAAKSEDATADVKLAPGQYVVHVAYGRAQASDTMVVATGENEKSMVLDAGAMRLNAAIIGDVAIPLNLLTFDIFSGSSETENTMVADDLSANDILTLNAGTYHVVSHFGSVNAVVRADLRVEPGQMTDATLYHRAAQVSFKLVTEAGGEAIADVEWTVKTADGSTVFSNIGAFPATVLSEGDYLVLAKRGDNVYNREFEVQPGAPREVEVLTTVY